MNNQGNYGCQILIYLIYSDVQVEGYRDSLFRYGCLDCRAVEKYLTGSLYGKRTCALNKRGTI